MPNVTHILAEDFLEFDSMGEVGQPLHSQQEKIYGIYKTIASSDTPLAIPVLIPQKILSLTEAETEWLHEARQAEEVRKPLDEVVQIITSILIGEKDPEMFGEFLGIMAKLIEDLANAGEVKYTLGLIKFLGNLAKNEKTAPTSKAMIVGAMGEILSDRTVKVLVQTLDSTELIAPEELLELLHVFGKPSLKRICEILGMVEKMKMRKVIILALIEIGHDSPEVFIPFLSDQRWFVVRNMLFILTRIGSPATLEQVVGFISHKEPAVRREVLNYLEKIPDAKAKTYLLKFLRDETSAIRIRALQVLTRARCLFALKPISAIAASEQFAEKEMAEKKAVFEAMGALGSDQMLPMFRDMLMKKYWFNKAKEKEAVICAVSGLSRIRSEAAVKLLEEARAVKGDETAEIIGQAIEMMTAENARNMAGS
jgi:HEAT repeat protein